MIEGKYFEVLKLLNSSVVLSVVGLLSFVPPAIAQPATSWRKQGTGIDFQSKQECIRHAKLVMTHYNFQNTGSSGNSGWKGEQGSTRGYVLCDDNGSQVYIFCAGDDLENVTNVCDNLERYMQE
ncbi:hypothetical protein [Geitlerinema sp. PCC 9228]|jgi:hypothetical protein|uniref:hypothetical protein n=1 Tax=Geitlerinema sp. PCC 9228 TaxID=111611 RepID=UPI001114A583|nr:hypothetical protein [Geitlerinema sp. PCC 9228]